MNPEEIRQFLVKANRNGYGNESVKEIEELDHSHTINYEEGDWSFDDNYFGGEPFGGREVIFYKKKPVWMMAYYGQIFQEVTKDLSQKEIYTFLKKALLNFPEDLPYRGPKELSEGKWQYLNKVEGRFTSFSGAESISYDNEVVYLAKYEGGLINQF